jgi:hypothetical protein
MRAVRAALLARLAALPRLVGLRLLPAGLFLVDFVLADFVLADFAPVVFDFALLADTWPDFRTDSSAACPATGETTIRTESTAATDRAAMLKIGTGIESVLISSLYSACSLLRPEGTTRVTAGCAKFGPYALARPTMGNSAFGSLPRRPLHSSFDGLIQQVPSDP